MKKTCDSCDTSDCSAKAQRPGERLEEFQDRQAIAQRLCKIRHKILVLSGKGGVGKSTVAANLAVSLAMAGQRVGLMDIDFHGPSIPKLLSLEDRLPETRGEIIMPIEYGDNLKVMSIGFLLRSRDLAVIWRGPLKMGAIKQFLKDVEWGELDYLIIDSPPGTGDEPLSVCQLIEDADGAIIVTTPQDLALLDVRKSITFCRQLGMPIVGVVENMSGLVCPHCGKTIDVFKTGGGRLMALDMGVPFLGSIPMDPTIVDTSDRGIPFISEFKDSETTKAFQRIVSSILEAKEKAVEDKPEPRESAGKPESQEEKSIMKIAIPLAKGKLSAHFGHCEEFVLIDVEGKEIKEMKTAPPPPHEPGLLPKWLHEQGAQVIIASGMGRRAQELFSQNGISVVCGAPMLPPDELARQYLEGSLQTGDNVCDH